MKEDIGRSGSSRPEGDNLPLSGRKLSDPVAGIGQSIEEPRQNDNRSGARRLLALDKSLVETNGDVPPENLKGCFAFYVKRARSCEGAFETNFEEIGGAALELKLRLELSEEEEGIQLDEDVVADLALNAEAGSRGEQFSASAELDSVGGESVVGLATEAGVVTGREIDGDAVELW